MANYSISYTSVTWTTGDIITEAKLDNMVSNEQSHEAHAADGYTSNNDIGYSQKDSGGTRRKILNVGTSNNLSVGDSNLGDLRLVTGASGFVKGTHLRQDNTTNSYVTNTVFLSGWGFILGDSSGDISETVTFGITFTAAPVVLISVLGSKLSSDPAAITELTDDPQSAAAVTTVNAQGITTTSFTALLWRNTPGTFTNTRRYGYAWLAIGQYT